MIILSKWIDPKKGTMKLLPLPQFLLCNCVGGGGSSWQHALGVCVCPVMVCWFCLARGSMFQISCMLFLLILSCP